MDRHGIRISDEAGRDGMGEKSGPSARAPFFSARRPAGRLIRAPLAAIPRNAVVRVLRTRARGRHWIAGSGPHSFWLGIHEVRKRRLFEATVRPGDVVYDIGANVGSYTLLASILTGAGGRVIAFEPLPENVRYLREHIRLNRLSNVEVLEAAAWDRVGAVHFDVVDDDRVLGRVSRTGPMVVAAVTLDALIESRRLPPPDVVKIDVEGGEARVLEGARETLFRARPALFIATHGEDVHREVMTILRSHVYVVRPIAGSPAELFATPGGAGGAKCSARPAGNR